MAALLAETKSSYLPADDVWLVEEEVRRQVGATIQRFQGGFFPDLEVHLVSSLQPL